MPAGSEFSPDRTTPPKRFRPGPGAIGQAAGLAAGKSGRRASDRPGAGRGEAGRGSRKTRLGLPGQASPQPEPGPAPGDYRHLLAIAQHANMRDLGRDIPFGVWAILNGVHRSLFKPGQWPFDVLED